MTELNDRERLMLAHGGDPDAPLSSLVPLLKSAEGKASARRRRTIPNIWTTMEGRGQPRQGFLSTDVMRLVYIRSEVIRACVDTLVELVSGVDWTIRAKDEEKSKWMRDRKPDKYKDQLRRIAWAEKFFAKPNAYQSLQKFHRVLLRDLLIFDAAGYEKVVAEVDGRRLPLELGIIAGDTIEIDCDDAGIPVGFYQSYNVLHHTAFEPSEIAYIQQNSVSWSPYGISPIETAYVSIAADLQANRYNASYFEKNGIPPALLAVTGLSSAEFRSLMAKMRSTSQDNPWNIHAFRAQQRPDGQKQDVFQLIPMSEVSNRDMQFTELLTHVVRRITMMYRISPSQIGFTDEVTGGIGSGVAETQVDLMENKGVAPLLRLLEETHTTEVLEQVCGWTDIEFKFTQSNTPSEQAERQQDMSELTSGAMTVNEYRSKWGGRDPVDWGDLPIAPPPGWQPPMSPQDMQQQLMQAQMGMGGDPNQGDPNQQGGMPPGQGGGGQPPNGMQPGQPPQPPSPPGQQPPQLQKSAEKRIIITF